MNKEVKINKKVLIVYLIILFILIILGVYVRYFNGASKIIKIFNKVEREQIIKEENNKKEDIEKPVIEEEPVKEEKAEENTTIINKEANNSNNMPKEETNNSKEDTTVDNSFKEEIIVKSDEQINSEYRQTLEQLYGVNIKYGSELGTYKIHGQIPTPVTDSSEIKTALKDINTYLGYYPKGMFKEIKTAGINLTINIVKNIPNTNVAGIADYEFGDDIKITVSTDSFFFRVFHHEIYHYMEKHMSFEAYPNELYPTWNSLNPTEFIYGNYNSNYSYHMINKLKGAYFINDYGQINEREDRATIFEDMMARAYKPQGCYDQGEIIWQKAKYISETIDKYFNTVSPNVIERWERFVY